MMPIIRMNWFQFGHPSAWPNSSESKGILRSGSAMNAFSREPYTSSGLQACCIWAQMHLDPQYAGGSIFLERPTYSRCWYQSGVPRNAQVGWKLPAGRCNPHASMHQAWLKGTKLHFKSPTAERRNVLCVGDGGDRTHAGPLQKSRVCPPWPLGHGGISLATLCATSGAFSTYFTRRNMLEEVESISTYFNFFQPYKFNVFILKRRWKTLKLLVPIVERRWETSESLIVFYLSNEVEREWTSFNVFQQ